MPMKVLVVDDDPTLRHLVAAVVKHDGYDVVEAPGGAEALELLKASHLQNPPVRAVI